MSKRPRRAQTISFNPSSSVNTTSNTLKLGVTDLVTGDAVTYNTNGGTAIGGLTNGKTYYVNVQADGTVKLYDSYADAVAAGATGLMTLTSAGSGSATMVSSTDNFGAYAISGAGGGKTGVAGSVAISITDDDTEADLGYTQPASSPGVPSITVTGAGNVTVNAQTATAVSASAVPANGGGTGANLGVGISVSLDYAQTQTLAQITNGVGLSGANNVTMTATSVQTMTTLTKGGSAGSTGITPVIAIAITDNNTASDGGNRCGDQPDGEVQCHGVADRQRDRQRDRRDAGQRHGRGHHGHRHRGERQCSGNDGSQPDQQRNGGQRGDHLKRHRPVQQHQHRDRQRGRRAAEQRIERPNGQQHDRNTVRLRRFRSQEQQLQRHGHKGVGQQQQSAIR